MSSPAVYIKTYGCQMNERDSEHVARQLLDRGYRLAASENEADVILLNTCSVRDRAEQKALGRMEHLRRLKRQNPRLILGFLGCMAQSRGQELLDRLPDLDLVVGTQQLHRVADYVDARVRSDKPARAIDIREEENSQNEIRDHLLTPNQTAAFVSVMQGCDMRCAFCIVPHTRGKQRSRLMNEILAEVRSLTDQGVKEITLLGQIVNRYGFREFPIANGRSPFVQLLYELEKIDGLERLRFTSPHPVGMKEDLFQAFRDLEKLCEHVHLPVQSGSDRILKKMRRAYTVEQYRRVVENLRAAQPQMAFTTDIIVGFPGEADEDFLQTRALVEETGFENAFIFKYSERKDTAAAVMSEKVPQKTKEQRNQELLGVIENIAARKNREMAGQTVEVLVEGPSKTKKNRLTGRTRANKIVVFENNAQKLSSSPLLPIKIYDATPFTLYGEVMNLSS